MGRQNLSVGNAVEVQRFLNSGAAELAPIFMGAVFFGAATYIGNSPNFMVKAIVDRQGVHAPTFFGLIFKSALPILLAVLYLVCRVTLPALDAGVWTL